MCAICTGLASSLYISGTELKMSNYFKSARFMNHYNHTHIVMRRGDTIGLGRGRGQAPSIIKI